MTDTTGEESTHRVEYGYDGRGIRVARLESPNTAGSASRHYFYTPELQLLESTVDDAANVWGQRARVAAAPLASNHEFVWFGGQPVAEIGPPRTVIDNTILSLGHRRVNPLAATDIFYIFTDHLGTPLLQFTPGGQVVWRAEHEPYGNVWLMRAGARTDQPLRLPGQDLAMTWEGSEENYNVFRWYRSGWGRYTQADPLGRLGEPNAYMYASDNPGRFVDPLGLKVAKCCRDIQVNTVINAVSQVLHLKHCFIKTDTVEAGLGPANGGPLPACPLGVPTAITNHAGQSQMPGTTCTESQTSTRHA